VDDEVSPVAVILTIIGVIVLIVGLVLGIGAFAGFKKVNVGAIALSYGGGPFESNHFQGVKQPQDGRFFNGLSDHLILLPTTTRNYLVAPQKDRGDRPGNDAITVQTSDQVNVDWGVNINFRLNRDPQTIKTFWETIGTHYGADDCLTNNDDCTHWKAMLDEKFRTQLETSLRDATAAFPFTELFGNRANQQKVGQAVGSELKENITTAVGGEFFCGPLPQGCPDLQVSIISFGPHDAAVADAIAAAKAAAQEQVRQKNLAAAADAQAQAIRKVSEALKAAGPDYVLLQILQQHPEKLPELWVVPQGSNVNVQRTQK
jgi:hypothetical protein